MIEEEEDGHVIFLACFDSCADALRKTSQQ